MWAPDPRMAQGRACCPALLSCASATFLAFSCQRLICFAGDLAMAAGGPGILLCLCRCCVCVCVRVRVFVCSCVRVQFLLLRPQHQIMSPSVCCFDHAAVAMPLMPVAMGHAMAPMAPMTQMPQMAPLGTSISIGSVLQSGMVNFVMFNLYCLSLSSVFREWPREPHQLTLFFALGSCTGMTGPVPVPVSVPVPVAAGAPTMAAVPAPAHYSELTSHLPPVSVAAWFSLPTSLELFGFGCLLSLISS